MYTFLDKSKSSVTLRPEGTVGAVRAILNAGLQYTLPHKVYYSGSMFRYERPQRGRYREFTQFGIEFMGSNAYSCDVECITVAMDMITQLKISNPSLKINSLGDLER